MVSFEDLNGQWPLSDSWKKKNKTNNKHKRQVHVRLKVSNAIILLHRYINTGIVLLDFYSSKLRTF